MSIYSIVLCRPPLSDQLCEGLKSLDIESWEAKAAILVRKPRTKMKKTRLISVLPGFIFVKATPNVIMAARDQNAHFLPGFRFLMLRSGPARVLESELQLFIKALEIMSRPEDRVPPKFLPGQVVRVGEHQWLSGLRATVVSQKGAIVKLSMKELNVTLKLSAFFLICCEAS